jgi:sulfite dehydrogenase
LKIELPAETSVFKPGQGAELANGQCLVCHSVEYVTMQPISPRPFWAASVKKMREKYGAAISENQVEPLLDYLTKHYGVETTNSASSVATNLPTKVATTTGPTPALGGEALATKYFCVLCHDVSAKKIGPPFKDIAAKYRTDPDASKKVAEQVHNGGSGKWGPVVMPPFPMVTDNETKAVAEWILGLK